jgi:hypothetical protein
MTSGEALDALLTRIADSFDGVVYVSEEVLSGWPKGVVSTLKADGLLRQASPAGSATCDGCERRCHMPVEVLDYSGEMAAFIFCDKLDNIDRVEVPLKSLNRWQSSGQAVAEFLAATLKMRQPSAATTRAKSWPVGMLRDKRSAHVELDGERVLTLKMAGHVVPLADVLRLKGKALMLDKQCLVERVNNPVAGGGTPGSAAERAEQITRLAKEEGVKAAAARFRISPSRVKQITAAHRKRSAATK